jgi:PAS domain S-box-containing protein
MARTIAAKDWAETPLGPIENWPQSLRTTVSLCLASNFPISLVWGPARTQIYNDGYWPICGAKHPSAMGQDFRECWALAWPVIGEAFESAERGEPRYLENQRIFLDRNGYLEETFFTFSFSPIRDRGGVQGVFHPVTETTARMLSERRTRAIRDLASCSQTATSVAAACAAVIDALAACPFDVPFALIYLLEEEVPLSEGGPLGEGGKDLWLAGDVGVERDNAAPATRIRLDAGGPIAGAMCAGAPRIVEHLAGDLAVCACGPYDEPPSKALILPITRSGADRHAGVLVFGISSRLSLDDAYRSFHDLAASQVAAAIATGRAYEAERKRVVALSELDRAKTAFFSNVSHEFRTPLTLMLGPLEEMLAHEDVRATRNELELVYRNALRLLRLVNALLNFSRIEAGRSNAVFEPIDLAALTADIASTFRSAVEMAGLRLLVDCAELPEPVYADRAMWETIVLNLLSNALKFTFHGEIRVLLRERNRQAILRVEDTGTGVPASALSRLFERFYRVEGASGRTFEGTGIGLALVLELAKLHGGTVGVESEVGVGSAFTVSVPLGFAHLPPERIDFANRAVPRSGNSSKKQGFVEESLGWLAAGPRTVASRAEPENGELGPPRVRILVADDNADMRQYIERLLADDYDVHSVSNGVEALEAALRDPPDLVLSDVMMPELDGFGLLAALRRSDATRLIPVVLLSARAGEESRSEGIGAGPDDYLVKPFAARELLARVRARIELTQLRRRLHEREVAERQWRLFDTALSNIPDHVYIYDLSHRFVYANRAALSLWHKSPEEWAGKNLNELGFPAEVASTIDGHLGEVIALGQALRHELMVTAPDGKERHYEYIFTPVFNPPGVVQVVVGTSRETTERRKTEERFQLVVEAAPNAMIMVSADGSICLVNGQTEKLFGYDRGELLGRNVAMLIPERFGSNHRGLLGKFFTEPPERAGRAGRELSGVRRDGREVPLEIALSSVNSADGEFVLASIVDITERKKAVEHSLLLTAVIEGAKDYGIFMLDPNGHVLTWNEGAARLKGYSEAEIVGQHFSRFYPPEAIKSGHPENELRIARALGKYEDEGWRVRGDGTRFWATVLITAVHDKDGKLRGFSKLTRDTTERKRTEERFQRVVEAAPSAMIMVGADGLMTLVNNQTEKLFGYHRTELLGQNIEMLIPARFRANHGGQLATFFAAPVVRAMGAGRDLFGVRKDGREVPIEIGLSPIVTAHGQFVLASVIDITERKRYEGELQSKSAEMERFTYTVSHDLKSPLITIKSYISMIDQELEGGNTDLIRADLQRVSKAADRMKILLDEVLALSRVGRVENTRQTVTLASLVEEALELNAGRIQQGNVRVEVAPDLPSVTVDRARIVEVLQNLIDNATKFMGDQAAPEISIGTSNGGAETRFFVKDNGVGLEPKYHQRIFGLFDKLNPKSEGSGAGLAIVKRIIELHGGRIWVESAGSGGSTFWFTLGKTE